MVQDPAIEFLALCKVVSILIRSGEILTAPQKEIKT
jgi:hypothetical protein